MRGCRGRIRTVGETDIKPLFLKRSSPLAKFTALAAISLALIVADHRFHRTEMLRAALSVIAYPIQYVVDVPVQAGRALLQSVTSRHDMLADNERLRAQNLLLKTRLQKFAALETENLRLRELLESSMELGERALVADLLGVETESASRQVMLNKGMNHGVYLGQPVVDANGVTGQITHVGPFTSTAMLITDPKHALPVQVIRSGVRGIASGGDDEVLSLNFVPTNADIRVGDLIVSSGLGGRFPSGYPVGEVSKVVRTPGVPFAKITVTPSAQLARTQQVLLLWPEEKPKEVAGTSLPAREVE